MTTRTAVAPGRVNLIGDHTDYAGGLALPMAIDLSTVVTGSYTNDGRVHLVSDQEGEETDLPVRDPLEASGPAWSRYIAGVLVETRCRHGFVGSVHSTIPPGSGLSSSAALEVATALALGFEGSPRELAEACQRAEQLAAGVPCGVMDQLTIASGIRGHALLIDFANLGVESVPMPDSVDVVVVHSGEVRRLAESAYADRRQACESASAIVGPLRDLEVSALDAIDDETIRARARHVLSENRRVTEAADALAREDLAAVGRLMNESHESLRVDFEVSTPVLDALVTRLRATTGVHGARLTGAGFGGCVVALTDPGVLDIGWTVRASAGARITSG